MKVSYSRIETFKKCPFQYKLKYIDKLKTLPSDDPRNPLILGHAIHTGIEKTINDAINEYFQAYPIINDVHITEALKVEYWLQRIKEILPIGEHEIKIENDDFLGFIDFLVPIENMSKEIEYFDLYDFKYSNNISSYMQSQQLHLYKYYFEKLNPNKKIRNLYFMFIPKSQLKIKYKNKTNKRDETLFEFRKRILEDMKNKKIEFKQVEYDPTKVIEFLTDVKKCVECVDFVKNESDFCEWCEFKNYCLKNIDYEIIKMED